MKHWKRALAVFAGLWVVLFWVGVLAWFAHDVLAAWGVLR